GSDLEKADHAARQYGLDLPIAHAMGHRDFAAFGLVPEGDGPALGQALAQPGAGKDIAGVHTRIVRCILEFQGKDAEIDQVLPADAGIADSHNRDLAQETGGDGGMLAAGPLGVIPSRHRNVAPEFLERLFRLEVEGFVYSIVGPLADGGDVTAK